MKKKIHIVKVENGWTAEYLTNAGEFETKVFVDYDDLLKFLESYIGYND